MSITVPTNQRKRLKRIQQALRKNPNDVEALLQLAAMLGTHKDPHLGQKRQVLHRILSLEPANRKAREMLLEMDRATIGGKSSRLSLAVILHSPSSNNPPEEPLTLRYSIVRQILVYLMIASMTFIGWGRIRDVGSLTGLGAFLIVPLWFVSAAIELSDSGLKVSRLFGIVRSEIHWRDIRKVRSIALGKGIKIINHQGKAVEISAKIHGYPFLVDILRQKRPDLFHMDELTGTNDIPQNQILLSAVIKTAGKT